MKNIMIVDDETDILKAVKSCLEEDDFAVVTASNSREALELMEGDKENEFGLILIDTPMPGSEKSALFSMKPESKVDTSRIEDFLQKPFTKEQLLDFVKKRWKNSEI
jgi:DNA-binding NtrC family response regulator